jgi:hypothetical protein
VDTMNSPRPFSRSPKQTFRPAFDYLSSISRSTHRNPQPPPSAAHRRQTSASSLDDTDYLDVNQHTTMEAARRSHSAHNSQSELQPGVPLIDLASRSNSPYSRTRSAAQSEDEDDDYEPVSSIRPLVSHDVGRGGSVWRGIWRPGGLGGFFFGTWLGWQVWIGLLVFWVGGCGFGLLLMNRFIMLTGVYKFPFPLTGTYVQLILTHILLVGFSSLTRALSGPLHKLGLGAAVAPAIPVAPQGGAFRSPPRNSAPARFTRWLTNGAGGIAGGGLFEFDTNIAKQVLPLAVVFVVKVLLSNFSFACVSSASLTRTNLTDTDMHPSPSTNLPASA